jgi:hypothetical protein
MVEKIFEKDEMVMSEVKPEWTEQDLIAQKTIFYLKDILEKLQLDPVKVKRKANDLIKKGQDPWKVMGVRKLWTHWIVRMSIFAPYYSEHLKPRVSPIRPEWDGNTLLKQKGLFLLTAVCKRIPFSPHQLRYRAKINPKAKDEYGIWKEEDLNVFVVDMEVFSKWVKGLWGGEFS